MHAHDVKKYAKGVLRCLGVGLVVHFCKALKITAIAPKNEKPKIRAVMKRNKNTAIANGIVILEADFLFVVDAVDCKLFILRSECERLCLVLEDGNGVYI